MHNPLNLIKGINKRELQHVSTVRGEGIFALDHDNNLMHMNDEAERILGWNAEDLSGKNFFNHVDFKVETIAAIGTSKCAALSSVGCSHLQNGASITRKNGNKLKVTFITLPVFDQGKMFGKVFVFCEAKNSIIDGELYHGIVECAGSIVIKLDALGQVAFANELTRNTFGDKLDHLVPTGVRVTLRENARAFTYSTQLVNRVKTLDGKVRQIAWSVKSVFHDDESLAGVVCVGNDITQHEPKGDLLLPERYMTEKVFEHINDGVITFDQSGVVRYLNPVAEQMTGWTLSDAKGLLLQDVFHIVDRHNRRSAVDRLLVTSKDALHEARTSSHILLRRDDWEFVIEETITPVHDKNGVLIGAAIIFRDASSMNGVGQDALYQSSHDALTGLINRTEFESHVHQALANAKSDGRQHAFCYLSIGILRDAVDNLLHDNILKQVSSLLYAKVRDTDVLARIADNEFGVLLKNCSLENAQEAAQSFCNEINWHSFIHDGEKIDVILNVGLIPITSGCGGLLDVMRIADSACYVARDKGRNRIHVYKVQDITLQSRQSELQWIHQIRQALDENSFQLYCQSIVPLALDAKDQQIHHEILLRMQDENGAIIRPGLFIPSAERYNLMPSIDRWVVKNALKILSEKLERHQPLGIFSINLSAQSLDDENFLAFVVDQLDRTNVPANSICFEITESTAISNLISATRFMSILRGMGCRFSLDDFGRGFSSYGYLKNLHIDYLKIDGSFVRDLSNDPVDHAMVESINQIGHIMGVQTIAEFVESEDVLEKLISLGVDHVQGYQLGKPRPMWQSFPSAAKH